MDDIQLAADGCGPLLQRDYWAVIRGCRIDAPEVARWVRERFADLAPRSLARFHSDSDGALQQGDVLEVKIRAAHRAGVRVVHQDDCSLTIATLKGHPEAGKITFGAYPNDRGDVIFHIRSRARAASVTQLLGFLVGGDPMQTNTWTDFVDRLAHSVGEGVVQHIHAEKEKVDDEELDADPHAPTYIARHRDG